MPYQQSLRCADLPPRVVFDDTRAVALNDQWHSLRQGLLCWIGRIIEIIPPKHLLRWTDTARPRNKQMVGLNWIFAWPGFRRSWSRQTAHYNIMILICKHKCNKYMFFREMHLQYHPHPLRHRNSPPRKFPHLPQQHRPPIIS